MKIIDKLYINGQWQEPEGKGTQVVINPTTEEPCVQVPLGNESDVEKAIAAARAALPAWSSTTAAQRAEFMQAIAEEMQNRYQDLSVALTTTMGSPKSVVGAYHVDEAIASLGFYADMAHEMETMDEKDDIILLKEPIGVCAFINPWNYPLHQMMGKVAPALAAGCTIITKPAEQTPLQDFIMAEIFDKAGLPAGVFNLVSGPGRVIGPVMCGHPEVDMVSFTGSTAAGVKVASAAAPTVKRVCQELGGKSAYIITDDADLQAAVRYGVEDVMGNTGQTCNALTRMFVARSRYQEALDIAVSVAAEQVVGDPFDENTTMGPMASMQQRDTVLDYISKGVEEGARIITGGLGMPEGLEKGAYVKPTIFADVSNDMTIAQEEIFGPVLCVIAYDDIEQAIQMANDSVYGLSSGVYARDKESALKIARRMQAGQCYIQGAYFSIKAPFGGYKQSGNGREWGEHGMHEYTETKAVVSG